MVALHAPAIKASFSGSRVGGEEWSTGLWVPCTGNPTQAELDAFTDDLHAAWRVMWGTPEFNATVSPSTNHTDTKCSFYPTDSLVSTVASQITEEPAVGGGINLNPYQCSLVASLRTAVPGRRRRGRMYLPCDALAMAAAGQYQAANLNAAAFVYQAFLTAVNGLSAPFTPADVAVVSHVDGQIHKVTSVILDSVPDIQRRRANRLSPASSYVFPL